MLTFNLLPPGKKERVDFHKNLVAILFYIKISLGLTMIFSLFMLFTLSYLSSKKALLGEESKKLQGDPKITEIQKMTKNIDAFNQELGKLATTFPEKKPSSYLSAIASLTPPEITLDKIEYVHINAKPNILLSGKAPIRENLLAYETNLKKSDAFKAVHIPLSNFQKSEHILFSITLELN